MSDFLAQVEEFQSAIEQLPRPQAMRLEEKIDAWTQSLRPSVSDLLRQARDADELPSYMQSLLEHLYERWNSHGLAVKLTLLKHVAQLSKSSLELEPVLNDYFDIKKCARLWNDPVAATS